jgi:hypothetical protein
MTERPDIDAIEARAAWHAAHPYGVGGWEYEDWFEDISGTELSLDWEEHAQRKVELTHQLPGDTVALIAYVRQLEAQRAELAQLVVDLADRRFIDPLTPADHALLRRVYAGEFGEVA